MQVSATTWSTLSKLLDEALDLEPAARDTWLERLSVSQPELAPSVLKLLAAHASSETADVLAQLPSLDFESAARASSLAPGDRIGPYRLKREIGAGGMADVWLAERADGAFTREVALKLPLINRLRRDLAQRFARERDILARLEHPNIARLYDAGVSDDGLPYLAMEYVDGQPITAYCDTHKLDIATRLRLFTQVLDAVQFAHASLIIHRDLKPSNILVTAGGDVRLLDFGIAKLIADSGTAHETQLTQFAGRALTPDYASPEQIKGESIGTASDVYSLGVVAYELLTGRRPYRLGRGSPAELEEAIATLDPPKASDATPDPATRKLLRGDLDAILNKALKKTASARYASVDALAQDIKRHLNSEPVMAQPDAFSYRASKFFKRYRLQAVAGSIAVGALLAGATIALMQAQRADAERRAAVAANVQAVASRMDAEKQTEVAHDERAAAVAARELAERLAAAERKAAAEADAHSQRAAYEATRAFSEAERARLESEQARAVRDYLVDLFRSASPAQADARKVQAMTAVELLDRGVERIDKLTAAAPEAKVELFRLFSDVNLQLGRYDVGLQLIQRAVAEADKVHGKDSLKALSQRLNLARTLSLTGQRQDAIRELDSTRMRLGELYPGSQVYANALTGSAQMLQPSDPGKALEYAQRAVQAFDAIAARDGPAGKLNKSFHDDRARALFALGLMLQTSGAVARSAVTLESAAAAFADLYGESSQDAVNVRSRLLFSTLALGRFDDVVREAPVLITAATQFDTATSLMVPQVRLYYGRALAALSRYSEARQQMTLALDERSRIANPTISPRVDTFRGQIALVSVEETRATEPMRELEALLAAGHGVPATRITWHVALLSAYRERGYLDQAREHAAHAERIAASGSAPVDARLRYLAAAAPLFAADAADSGRLEQTLQALREAEATAESDHQRALFRTARAQALHLANRRPEAAEELRPLVSANSARAKALQHQGLRAQIDSLAADVFVLNNAPTLKSRTQ